MYGFDKKNHIHLLDGKPLHGVTTVLGDIIAKGDGIIQWAWKLGREGKDWKEQRDGAGTKGTDIHLEVERYVRGCMDGTDVSYDRSIKQFVDWSVASDVKFLASEKNVYSKELWVGGICDLILEIDGKRYIGDVKTSKSIYWSQFLQMGAYQLCLEEMGEKPFDGSVIIRMGKDGSFETQMSLNTDRDKQGFIHALELYKIKKTF
jgi:hypothetical protein